MKKNYGELMDIEDGIKHKAGFVYLIKDEKHHLTKIGKAASIIERFGGMKTSAPFLYLYGFLRFNKEGEYQKIEKLLHKHFATKRVVGEWFDLSIEDLERIKTKYSKQYISGEQYGDVLRFNS
jgi:T5orf172 domain